MHAGAIGIEDAGHLDLQLMLPVVIKEEGLGTALALVVAGPRPDRVHVSPVGLHLGMDARIAVDLGGGGLQNPCLQPLRESQHVDGPMDVTLVV